MFRETEPRVLRAKAQAAVSGSKITGDILPRYVYELAEEPVPPGATDKLQRVRHRLRIKAYAVDSNGGGGEIGAQKSSSTTNLFHHYFPARADAYLCIPGAG